MTARVRGVTLAEMAAALVIVAVMVAIFFPVFQRNNHLPNGAVMDSLGRPIPGAVLRFRDSAGRTIATITADSCGSFHRDNLDALSKNAIVGFGLTTQRWRTGSGTLYTFTPLGTQTATFHDNTGKPVVGLAVILSPAPRTWYHDPNDAAFYQTTDKTGTTQLTNVPSGARFYSKSMILAMS